MKMICWSLLVVNAFAFTVEHPKELLTRKGRQLKMNRIKSIEPPTQNNQATQPIYYAILLSQGEQWKAGKSVYEQDLKAHGQYMKRLFDDGALLMAGPYTDNEGALILLKVKTREEATALMNNDPAVQNKTFKAVLHEWKVFFEVNKN